MPEHRKYLFFNPNSRFATIIIALAHFLIIAIGFFSFISYQKTSADLLIQQDSQLAFLSAIRLNRELQKFADELNQLARDPVLLSDDPVQRNRKLQSLKDRLGIFDGGAILLDHEGTILGSIPFSLSLIGDNWSERDFFSVHLANPRLFLSDAVTLPRIEGEVVVLSVPLVTSENEFKGVLAGLFRIGASSVSSFYASIVKLRLGLTGSTYLIDNQGRILYDSATLATRNISDISYLEQLDLSGSSGAYRARDEQGNQVIAAFSSVPDTNWKLVIEDDWDILTQPVRRDQNIILGFLGFGMVLPAVSVAILSRLRAREEQRITSRDEENKIADDLIYRLSTINPPYVLGWDFYYRPMKMESEILLMQDIFVTDNGRLIGNFAFHKKDGISSALMLHQIKTVLHSAFHNQEGLKKAVETANKLVYTHVSEDNPISLFCIEINPVSGVAEYINLGFEGVYHLENPDNEPNQLKPSDRGLGFSLEPHFHTKKFQISAGGKVLLFVHQKHPENTTEIIHDPQISTQFFLPAFDTPELANGQFTDINSEYFIFSLSRNKKD